MCGIWALFGKGISEEEKERLLKLAIHNKKRGPDSSKTLKKENAILRFDRLGINGLDEMGMQPFEYNDDNGKFYLICNGEIYNHKELSKMLGHIPNSKSDCEIIGWMYATIRNSNKVDEEFKSMISLLDGVFSLIIYDELYERVCVARDRYGVRPLYYGVNESKICFGSTLETVHDSCFTKIEQYPQNSISVFNINNISDGKMAIKRLNYLQPIVIKSSIRENFICNQLKVHLENAVEKRLMSERKICCLLSGGLDSSLITSIVCKIVGDASKVDTFSIGMPGSTDGEYAQKVANFLGTNHKHVMVDKEYFFSMIPEVIKNIGSYDTTTVRASVGNYLISKYISETTDNIVVFNGDGSDELFGGYIYIQDAPDITSYHKEIIQLLTNIHHFDVLRSDRSISSNGLEARTPFLDHDLTSFWLSIHPRIRKAENKIEKYLLRKAFEKKNENDYHYLPDDILWRKKEAFSDGVSSKEDSWHSIIKEKLEDRGIPKGEFDLAETNFYYQIFKEHYNHLDNPKQIIPHLWLPKWNGNKKDPSARTLESYDTK
jgi:asparagine synthase (glutamine-hydrolysing)